MPITSVQVFLGRPCHNFMWDWVSKFSPANHLYVLHGCVIWVGGCRIPFSDHQAASSPCRKSCELTWSLGVTAHIQQIIPFSKVHGANMGPIWGRQDPGGPHVGPMNLAICDSSVIVLQAMQMRWGWGPGFICMEHAAPDAGIINSSSGGDGKWVGGKDGQELIEFAPCNTASCDGSDPDNKAHGTNMGTTWVLSAPDGPHVGPMNLAIREFTSATNRTRRIEPHKGSPYWL